MNEKQIARWEKIKRKGFILYVLQSALIWGACITISSLFFNRIWDGIWKTNEILENFIIYSLVGVVLAWIDYNSIKGEYEKFIYNQTKK